MDFKHDHSDRAFWRGLDRKVFKPPETTLKDERCRARAQRCTGRDAGHAKVGAGMSGWLVIGGVKRCATSPSRGGRPGAAPTRTPVPLQLCTTHGRAEMLRESCRQPSMKQRRGGKVHSPLGDDANRRKKAFVLLKLVEFRHVVAWKQQRRHVGAPLSTVSRLLYT